MSSTLRNITYFNFKFTQSTFQNGQLYLQFTQFTYNNGQATL